MKVDPGTTISELSATLSYILDLQNGKKIFHGWRTGILSLFIAKEMDLREYRDIFYAAILHDCGAVGFPFHIIHYLKKTSHTSQSIILSHPIIGAQLVSGIPGLSESAKLILDHHEWLNGQGYPRAKLGPRIPMGAQVIRVADSIDICLQGNKLKNLSELKKRLSLGINKQYSKSILSAGLNCLGKNRLFENLNTCENIEEVFQQAQSHAGLIRVPFRIDAIGQALQVGAEIIDMKHPFTHGHSVRVARYALTIALNMKLSHDEVTKIKWAALLHDLGKISVPRKILDKPGKLNPEEFNKIKEHADISAKIIKTMPSLEDIIPIAACHHEYFNGSGYPRGLKAEDIPLGARIITACDAFDAMTSVRPYRTSLLPKSACSIIRSLSGKQFDPEVVRFAIPIFRNLVI